MSLLLRLRVPCGVRVRPLQPPMSWETRTATQQRGSSDRAPPPSWPPGVGSGAELDDCIVTNAWDASFIREDWSPNEVRVALNCNAQVASAGKPGNSAASPAGREAKAAQERAAAAERRQLQAVDTPNR